ncbi:MAG TPA: hypothetical protein VE983_11490 [Solirubrobacteraceae bacterium]|nr:hypothetical protein [Solirubrobacteraceae bacterium]
MRAEPPTAALAAAGLVGGYGVAVATGSRPLGGLVLVALGVPCIAIWSRRHGPRRTILLTAGGLFAFGLSHALGVVIGAWPAVLVTAAGTGAAYWRLSDSHRPRPAVAGAPGRAPMA